MLPVTGDTGDRSAAPGPWQHFQDWRRTRPFWGGLFLLVSGLEFYLSGHLDLLPLKVSFGAQSFLAWLIPIALVLCGVLVWYTPAQRVFYGILGAAISVAALIGLNLGGFFVGMLCGIVGGALAFSWEPAAPVPASPEPDALPEPDASAQPPGGRHVAGPGDGPPGRLLTLILLIAVVTAGLLVLPAPGPAAAAPCPSTAPAVSASPAPSPSGTPAVNPVVGFFQQLGRLLGLGGSGPVPTPSPSLSRPAPVPSPSCGSPTPGSRPSTPPAPKRALPAGVPVVNAVPSTQITALLSQSGLSFDGITDLPTHAGTLRVLQFSLRSSSSTPFELRVPAPNGGTISLRSSKLTVAGQVRFYTTQIKGRLLGLLPVTYTPESPPPLTPPELFFTDATVQLVFVHAATLTAPALRIAYL